ncbi:hypothetical protein JKP88DRAFT_275216 [Tribonema minus]|uniref:Sec20 C-terminal domain-containing protein n=1 Tax=Tribonema minus TaxID=303371 RepID=A0A835ZB28_9STRA|nr:hypothetical protein JKP88DRAFT_275216 [Tribonema minus]
MQRIAEADRLLEDLSRRVKRLEAPAGDGTVATLSESSWQPPQDLQAFNKAAIRVVGQCREALEAASLEAQACSTAQNELDSLRTALRGALLQASRHVAQRRDARRDFLLAGAAEDDGSGDQSAAVASSLARSRRVMAEQVARMSSVAQLVGEQDQLLRDTAEEHKGVGGTVGRASMLLTRLNAQAIMDAVAMAASTAMFFAAVLYVIWARVPGFGLF